jgi:hypothetical protein
MRSKYRLLLSVGVALLAISCSIMKKDDPEKEVRDFLGIFQTSLTGKDEDILAQFRVDQSPEALIKAIRVLQNTDSYVFCDFQVGDAGLRFESGKVQVYIPTRLSIKGLDRKDSANHVLTLWLTRGKDNYFISQFDGEQFYQSFLKLKNSVEWEAQQAVAMGERQPIYNRAHELEAVFDSVIWFANSKQETYFYVTKGPWSNTFLHIDETPNPPATKMGLTDSRGNVIIPLEYDRIGALNFLPGNLVEVTRSGKVGYFDVARKVLVAEPLYDFIIPYSNLFLVKADTTYGWLDQAFLYHTGFPNPAAGQWLKNFEFLRQPILIAAGKQTFCEIPSGQFAGNGLLPMPSYLYKFGVFQEIESGISTTAVPIEGWSEYVESLGSRLERIGEKFSVIVTSIRERYLEGREEFYDRSMITVVTNTHDALGIQQIPLAQLSVRQIDTLLEVSGGTELNEFSTDVEEGFRGELNANSYFYYGLSPSGKVTPLTSDRRFPQTQFVRLDSTYLKGDFYVLNSETRDTERTAYLSTYTLEYMMNELLAANGYRFPDVENVQRFVFERWYVPKYTELAECEAQMNAIDRHNLDFLRRMLAARSAPAM